MADQNQNPRPKRKRNHRHRGRTISASAPKVERVQQMMLPRQATHQGRKPAWSADKHSDLFLDAIIDTPIRPSGLAVIIPVEGPPCVTVIGATFRDVDQLMRRIEDGIGHFASELIIEALRDVNTMLAASGEDTLKIVRPQQTL